MNFYKYLIIPAVFIRRRTRTFRGSLKNRLPNAACTGRVHEITGTPRFIVPFFSILLMLGGLGMAEIAKAQPNIGVKVEVDGKADFSAYKVKKKIQTRSLKITVSNGGQIPAGNLKIRWTLYCRTMAGNDIVEIASEEESRPVAAKDSVTINTPEVTIEGAREHSVASGRGRRSRYKDVPASGNRYYGYTVEVFAEGRLVGATYSQPSLKNLREKNSAQ